jgi:predicted DNA-binding transcriptional regulator AlpA
MQKTHTLTQALPLLGLTRCSAYIHIKSGKLPATKSIVDGRAAWLIAQADLDAFLKSRGRNA